MESLESQVSEFRYLTQNAPLGDTSQTYSSPDSAAGNNSAQRHASLSSGPADHGTANAKRKSDDDAAQKQQRSKRNRYISIACNECKRRKIKCNGETPCQRCGNLNLQCLYAPNCCSNSVKDSEEFKQMSNKVTRLQEQVETLFSNMNALRSETLRLVPTLDRALPLPSAASSGTPSSSVSIPSTQRPDLAPLRQPGFRGPTSTHFTLDVAKNTLHKMGYSNINDAFEENVGTPDDRPALSPMFDPQVADYRQRQPRDPIWEFDKDEMIRLCRLHEEEIGIMYPVVHIESVVNHAKTLGSWLEAAKKNLLNGQGPAFDQDGGITDTKTLLLKTVMSCALVIEEHGHSDRATGLMESVLQTTGKMLMNDEPDVANMPLLALVAGYRFLCSDEILAWRLMGQVARQCIELGLHRRNTIMQIADEEERRNAIVTFWSAYVIDRRWSFATGLPYVVPDGEVDPDLPYPDSLPYLVAMISFSQLCAKVWRLIRRFEPNAAMDLQANDIEDVDQQIKQWYTAMPADNQLELADWDSMPEYLVPSPHSQKEYDIHRLQIWTYLRINQIRIWLHTPILHTHSSIMENLPQAERVVKLARNTIKYLRHLNNTTNIYRKSQVFYHQFLTSAIAVLFLASCHAPVNFSSSCRDEFYMALELVKDLSSKSWVSQRLWRTIKSLKEVAPRLGLAEDPHSNAALTMAGLATGHMGPTPTPPPGPPSFSRPPRSVAGTPVQPGDGARNGLQISTEMSKIFEGYVGLNGFDDMTPATMQTMDDYVAVGSGSVYQHFTEMF
ncbi:uncharacterized protein BCR38DRAFT_489345 [Pseudomassariella vexata]|uniref:Zn(2)-C6 fungal-type domain-containing protein n=1 Tax=Pseudomassariella vexata TaxID=1141098 RepID=A0A1Y2DGP7_9PEZI|nr:uncharacterized protein BCR38DRAFT_489345 [Pseudomassariella vexata]ORY58419.1 hypothetical protein BCR38DRAFT_489345 [Pseudomassariella vexata]